MSDYQYRQTLKDSIKTAVENLNPRYHERDNAKFIDCPHCNEKEAYLSISEFKYGRCTECSREDGYEYYSKLMSNRLIEYKQITEKINNLLETL